jgi:hypothetical protein
MTATVHDSERAQLERIDRHLEKWMEILKEEAGKVDIEQLRLFVKTTRRLAARFDEELPPTLEPAAMNEIRGIILGGIRKLDQADDSPHTIGPLDVLDDFLVRAESIRHILRDVLDEDIGPEASDAGVLIAELESWLPGVPRREIARLGGFGVRTSYRYAKGGTAPSHRLTLVARLAAILRRGWTPQGVVAWFDRPREDLDSRKPIDVLDDPAYEHRLMRAARSGRAQHGA